MTENAMKFRLHTILRIRTVKEMSDMETVLYELRFRWGDLLILLIPLLVGIGFWAVSCGRIRSEEAGKELTSPVRRDLSRSRGLRWFLRGVALLCGVVFILAGGSYLGGFADLKNRYGEGDYLTAEGFVRDLSATRYPDKGGDSFTVDGVTFAYSEADLTLLGYRKEAQHGGAITREGQYVVIRYVHDEDTDTNHILYIAEREVP